MPIIEAINVFGALCSIYSTFKDSGKKPDNYGTCIAETIKAIDIFKETHSSAQKLGEFSRTFSRDQPLDPKTTNSNKFISTFRLFQDRLNPFVRWCSEYERNTFSKIKVEHKGIYMQFSKELNGLNDSVEHIRDNFNDFKKEANEALEWARKWRAADFKPKHDIDKFSEYLERSEETARQVLAGADAALMSSITLLRVIAVELL